MLLPLVQRRDSSNTQAAKFVWGLPDRERVESVYLRFPTFDSLCISSQVGCALKCAFCATGLDGFKRDLVGAEIAGQVESAFALVGEPERGFEVSFMGMGEPLQNLDHVLDAVDRLRERWPSLLFSLSTVGMVPQMRDPRLLGRGIQLQVSLHSPRDASRKRIIPLTSKYPIAEVLGAAQDYAVASGLPLYVNYLLLRDLNDSDADATALAETMLPLAERVPLYLKLAQFNEIDEIDLRRSSPERLEHFEAVARRAGVPVYPFRSSAVDVNGGCGQLRAGRARAATPP